jgi:DNA-binding PadR family transcriptional regulator
MPGRTSAGTQVLLGLLTIEPMSGYDLRVTIRETVGYFWNESYGQIYPNLHRLAAEGLVKRRTERQPGKPDRHIYSITEKGRERLRKWLAVPPQPEIPRNELLLKLFFGDQVPAHTLIAYVARMAEEHRALLALLARAEREQISARTQYGGAPYWRMAVHFGQMELEAHLRWAEETLAELSKLAAKQRKHGKAHVSH